MWQYVDEDHAMWPKAPEQIQNEPCGQTHLLTNLNLLCSSCRVRPLSESVNDLFREVSLLRRRITELSHRLATLEPFLRHHGYREKKEEEEVTEEEEAAAAGGRRTPHSLRAEMASLARYSPRTAGRAGGPPRGSRVVRRRRVRVLNGGGRLVQREGEAQWWREEEEGRESLRQTEKY